MAYRFSPLSTPDGVRDVQVDCTNCLKPLELISSVTVVSKDTTLLTISDEAVNTTVLTKDDGVSTIGVGKGVEFTVNAVRRSAADVEIEMVITGDISTVEKVSLTQPLPHSLAS